jgi:hypothetical protein
MQKYCTKRLWLLGFLLNEDLGDRVYKPAEGLENTITLQTINILSSKQKETFKWRIIYGSYQKMLQSSKMTSYLV